MFGRHNVDNMLDEMTHESFSEWCAFLQLEPQGWSAHRIMAGRIAFYIAQTPNRKKLRESDFVPRTTADRPENSDAVERTKMEAFAIRGMVEQQIREGRTN